ncbi:hypothetical protein K1T71_009039 [Dendrolimus kikuchii]|uniref:Uncharacterized protein n=1 Tax=Dendrolimus kikuchii TaxID=765133 RepID=A0ACC1CWP5_9NEOP|nr:hypothetical protein K1T71_009039 [Dendrolimus kikuchii]
MLLRWITILLIWGPILLLIVNLSPERNARSPSDPRLFTALAIDAIQFPAAGRPVVRGDLTTHSQVVIVSRSDTDIQILLAEEENASLKNKQVNGKPKTRRTAPIKGAAGNEMDTFKNDIKDMIQELICAQNSRMDKLESHIMEIKNQNVKIENTNHEIEKSMTFVSEQLTSLETKISGLEKDRMSLAKNVAAIQERVETFDHNLIKTSIEIRNVPKKTNESKNMLYDMILNLSKQLAMNISEFNIREVVRHPSRKEKQTSNITVEFTNTLIKSHFLVAVKQYNQLHPKEKLNSTLLGFETTPKVPIYIAEQLTSHTKRLFYLARNFAKLHNYKFCWTSNGRVLLKKEPGEQYIVIKNEGQLQQLNSSSNNK